MWSYTGGRNESIHTTSSPGHSLACQRFRASAGGEYYTRIPNEKKIKCPRVVQPDASAGHDHCSTWNISGGLAGTRR
jgi:hypothetical protein